MRAVPGELDQALGVIHVREPSLADALIFSRLVINERDGQVRTETGSIARHTRTEQGKNNTYFLPPPFVLPSWW